MNARVLRAARSLQSAQSAPGRSEEPQLTVSTKVWTMKPGKLGIKLGMCSLLAAVGINACDAIHQRELQPGISTAQDVSARFGLPEMEWVNADGTRTWEYSRQPQGIECFMITIGPDNVLRGIEQVLNEQTFARITPGMSADEVRRLLGKPATIEFFSLKQETVWSWKIDHGIPPGLASVYFTVSFDMGARVSGSGRYTERKG